MTDLRAFRVARLDGPEELPGGGLHWFRIDFDETEGRCFITTGEAHHLRELTDDWVERALTNLAARYGHDWLKDTACSSPGLVLHYSDA